MGVCYWSGVSPACDPTMHGGGIITSRSCRETKQINQFPKQPLIKLMVIRDRLESRGPGKEEGLEVHEQKRHCGILWGGDCLDLGAIDGRLQDDDPFSLLVHSLPPSERKRIKSM